MKINLSSLQKVQTAIEAAQNSSRTRKTSAESVLKMVERVESNLADMLLKKDWTGLVFVIDTEAQDFPSSYAGIPESTKVTIEFFKSGAFITDVSRSRCSSRVIEARNISEKSPELSSFAQTRKLW